MEWNEVNQLIETIRQRIKKEAKNYKEIKTLHYENPKLAQLCNDIDEIIQRWAWDYLKKTTFK